METKLKRIQDLTDKYLVGLVDAEYVANWLTWIMADEEPPENKHFRDRQFMLALPYK